MAHSGLCESAMLGYEQIDSGGGEAWTIQMEEERQEDYVNHNKG